MLTAFPREVIVIDLTKARKRTFRDSATEFHALSVATHQRDSGETLGELDIGGGPGGGLERTMGPSATPMGADTLAKIAAASVSEDLAPKRRRAAQDW